MQLDIKGTELEITQELRTYAEKRLEPLWRFVKRYETNGETHMFVEIARTTKHHKKGNVFYAEATMALPKAVLRAEAEAPDSRAAIDTLKDILKREMKKYKEKNLWKT
ncbi:MAG: ribosome-associated translation inhibitor RaiA [Candidatus Wildermuthbacteria bacterium]|nr:ribosome-associated translation inhibitor RaiA [Candidatus Wildermuthbacteria bacterium]